MNGTLFGIAAVVVVVAYLLYVRFVEGRNARNLDDMIAELPVTPTTMLHGEMEDVALGWIAADECFVYLNAISGTSRRIEKQDVHSLEVQENSLVVSHVVDTMRKKEIGEELGAGINDLLPANIKDKIERLEIVLITKDGLPPMGLCIPIIESEAVANNKNYLMLRNEIVEATSNWRAAIGTD